MKTVLTAIAAVALLCTMITANADVFGLRLDANGTTVRWSHTGWTQMQLADRPWTVVCGTNNKWCEAPQTNKRYRVSNLTYGGSAVITVSSPDYLQPRRCGFTPISGAGVKGMSVNDKRVTWASKIRNHWVEIQSRNGNRTFYQGTGDFYHILESYGPYKIIDHSVRGRPVSHFDLAPNCKAP